MSEWTKTIKADSLREGEMKAFSTKMGAMRVLLIRNCGEIFAVDPDCPHMGLSLQIGRVDRECTLFCPWHRSAFDLRSGDVKDWAPWPPGIGRVLGKIRREQVLPTYAVKIEDDHIWVGPQTNIDEG